MAKPKAKAKTSIKTFLVGKLKTGTYSVADAIRHAHSTGRSEVTCRRMAGELGYRAKRGVFVKAGK